MEREWKLIDCLENKFIDGQNPFLNPKEKFRK